MCDMKLKSLKIENIEIITKKSDSNLNEDVKKI